MRAFNSPRTLGTTNLAALLPTLVISCFTYLALGAISMVALEHKAFPTWMSAVSLIPLIASCIYSGVCTVYGVVILFIRDYDEEVFRMPRECITKELIRKNCTAGIIFSSAALLSGIALIISAANLMPMLVELLFS